MTTTDPAEPLSELRDNIYYILDENDNPIPMPRTELQRWAQWWEENHHKERVAATEIGHYLVSTIFLPINLRIFSPGPPALWETVILDQRTDSEEPIGYQRRHTSLQAALEGHEQAVILAQNLDQ